MRDQDGVVVFMDLSPDDDEEAVTARQSFASLRQALDGLLEALGGGEAEGIDHVHMCIRSTRLDEGC